MSRSGAMVSRTTTETPPSTRKESPRSRWAQYSPAWKVELSARYCWAMSEENVRAFQRAIDAANRRDVEA